MRKTIALCLFLSLVTGCQAVRSKARDDVRQIASYHYSLEARGPCRISSEPIDRFLRVTSDDVLKAAKDVALADGKRRRIHKAPILPDDRFEIVLLHDTRKNAHTRGVDYCAIYTGAFEGLDRFEAFCAVVCHEYAHIECEHLVNDRMKIRREMDKTTALAALAGGIAGAAGQGMALPLAVIQARNAKLAGFCPHDKADEFEADAYGFRVYCRLGYDPQHFIDMLEWLDSADSATHPSSASRAAAIRAIVPKSPHQPYADTTQQNSEFKLCQTLVAREVAARRQGSSLVDLRDFASNVINSNRPWYVTKTCGSSVGYDSADDSQFWSIVKQRASGH